MSRTLVHLVRHGEVDNPDGVLYGRLEGYGLTELGHAMAEQVARSFTEREADVVHLAASPLQRAQETVAPLARAYDLPVRTDERMLEATSVFEGLIIAPNPAVVIHPRYWRHLLNPWRPSWGEPYLAQVARVTEAVRDARRAAEGHEAVIVSHQSPIWLFRTALEGRRFVHDPRKRQCTLASVTTLTFDGAMLVGLDYTEPAADLLARATAIT